MHTRINLSRCAATLAAMLAIAASHAAVAQGVRPGAAPGSVVIITGTVKGPNGVIIPGAKVTAITSDSVSRAAATNDNGKYTIIFQNGGGAYHVTVTAPGYNWWAGDVRKAYNDDRIVVDVSLQPSGAGALVKRPSVSPAVTFERNQLGPNDALYVVLDSGDVLIHGTSADQIVYRTYSPSFSLATTDSMGVVTAVPKEIAPTGSYSTDDRGLTISAGGGHSLVIDVPRTLKIVRIRITGAGMAGVSDFAGQIAIQSAAGDVRLDRISGPALVEARNGAINASIATIPSTMNFLGHNGAITVTLPTDARASVSTEVHQGSIFHDSTSRIVTPQRFTITQPLGLEAFRVGMPGPMEGTKSSWIMNGGGAPITVTTLNGNIIIRKAPLKPPAEEREELPPLSLRVNQKPEWQRHFRLGTFF